MKKKLVLLSALMAVSAVFCFLLAYAYHQRRIAPNGFNRYFPPHLVSAVRSVDLKFNSYDLVGSAGNFVYLANYTSPSTFFRFTTSLSDSSTIVFQNMRASALVDRNSKIRLKGDSIYIFNSVSGRLLTTSLNNPGGPLSLTSSNAYFMDAVMKNANLVFFRSYNQGANTSLLGILDLKSGTQKIRSGLLTKQVDGIFCTSGTLLYRPPDVVIYVYTFRNEFIVADTGLSVRYKGHTIDTTTRASIVVEQLYNGKEAKISEPPKVVSSVSCIHGDLLFVYSPQRADNESSELSANNFDIDVYAVRDGSYRFSFYLSKTQGNTLTSMYSENELLYVVTGSQLTAYKLNFPAY